MVNEALRDCAQQINALMEIVVAHIEQVWRQSQELESTMGSWKQALGELDLCESLAMAKENRAMLQSSALYMEQIVSLWKKPPIDMATSALEAQEGDALGSLRQFCEKRQNMGVSRPMALRAVADYLSV